MNCLAKVLAAALAGGALFTGCVSAAGAVYPPAARYTAQAVGAAVAGTDWDAIRLETAAVVDEAMRAVDWEEIGAQTRWAWEYARREAEAAVQEAFEAIDWDSITAPEPDDKRQAVEVQAMDGTVLHTMTEKQDIVAYVRGERIEQWQYLKAIPGDAEALCRFVSKQERTRTVTGPRDDRLYVVNITTLYRGADGYYIRSHTTEEVPMPVPVPDIYAKIADEAGDYLLSLTETTAGE